jgi:hypothetical protein
MNPLPIALFLFVLLAVLVLISKGASRHYPYQQREHLFTPAEWRFYQVLRNAVPEGLEFFGKVRVADVLKPEAGLDRSTWQRSFNKIAGKHFDFILVESTSGRMVCGIELNDHSHQRRDRQERDAFLTGACKNARFPLLMVPAARQYDVVALREQIQQTIAGTASAALGPSETSSALPLEAQVCPKCGSPLVEKTARRGKNAGRTFLSCADFPRCRYSRAL